MFIQTTPSIIKKLYKQRTIKGKRVFEKKDGTLWTGIYLRGLNKWALNNYRE